MFKGNQDAIVSAFLDTYCGPRRRLRDDAGSLWGAYRDLQVSGHDHFVQELTSGNEEKFWQRMWEMQLGVHLSDTGHLVTSPAHGPDYRFEDAGLTVWVEAISPSPSGLPPTWLNPPMDQPYSFPHQEVLLKWTGAFKEKRARFQRYAGDQVVGPGDACVIAISGAQLSHFDAEDHGITTLPWAVETVLPVGPMSMTFFRGKPLTKAEHSHRLSVPKRVGVAVPLDPFLDPACAQISALVGCTRRHHPDPELPLCVVHNPLAVVPIRLGLFGPHAEEWAVKPGDHGNGAFSLTRVR